MHTCHSAAIRINVQQIPASLGIMPSLYIGTHNLHLGRQLRLLSTTTACSTDPIPLFARPIDPSIPTVWLPRIQAEAHQQPPDLTLTMQWPSSPLLLCPVPSNSPCPAHPHSIHQQSPDPPRLFATLPALSQPTSLTTRSLPPQASSTAGSMRMQKKCWCTLPFTLGDTRTP